MLSNTISSFFYGNTGAVTPARPKNPPLTSKPNAVQSKPREYSADEAHQIFNLLIDHSDAMLDALEAKKPSFWDRLQRLDCLSFVRKDRTALPFFLWASGKGGDEAEAFKFNPNVPNHRGEYLLMRAAKNGKYPNAIKNLIATGAELDIQDKQGRTPLMHTILQGDEAGALALIAAGARLDMADKENQRNALHYALMENTDKNNRIAEAILAKHEENRPYNILESNHNKALYHQADKQGRIPLVYALINRSRLIAEKLVNRSGNWDKPDEDGYTPLLYAAKDFHNEALIPKLIVKGANCLARDKQGRTPLMHAAIAGSVYSVDTLSERGVEHLTARDNEGKTPLMYVAIHEKSPEIRRIIWKLCMEAMGDQGRDPIAALLGQRDYNGQTALMHAAKEGNIEGIKKLHEVLNEMGTDLNSIDRNGNTALMHAVQSNQPGAVYSLCKLGANPNIKNHAGKSAYQIAQELQLPLIMNVFHELQDDATENGLPINIEDYIYDEDYVEAFEPSPPASPPPLVFNTALGLILGQID